jgi:hypothetical protein
MVDKKTKRSGKRIIIGIVGLSLLVCLGFGIYVMVSLASFGSSFWSQYDDWSPEQEPWVQVLFALPEGPESITFARKNAHPFLAEYYRKLYLHNSEEQPLEVVLPMNSGGNTLINTYFIETTRKDGSPMFILHLLDRHDHYYVDLGKGSLIHPDHTLAFSSEDYIGRLDDRSGSLEFITVQDAPEEPIEML